MDGGKDGRKETVKDGKVCFLVKTCEKEKQSVEEEKCLLDHWFSLDDCMILHSSSVCLE